MDRDKYNALLTAYIPDLFAHALRLAPSYDDAEDLLQETALQLLEKRTLYIDQNFIGWGYTHLHNIFINTLHKKKPFACDLQQSFCETKGYKPEMCILYDFRQAIKQLSPALRTVTQMYLEGYRYDEIAQLQHISVGTVKSRISRARCKLQTSLQAYKRQ